MNNQYIRVESMISPRSNKPVANQFIIYTPQGRYFQSYQTVIAFFDSESRQMTLDKNSWDYSRTTLKYLHRFLETSSKKEIEECIKDGIYKLVDLN